MRSLGKEVNINPPLVLGQLPDTPEELLKLDQVSKYISTLNDKPKQKTIRRFVVKKEEAGVVENGGEARRGKSSDDEK